MSTLVFYAQFTASKVGKQDLTVTVDIARITRSDGTQATEVSSASATQIILPNKRGAYLYVLAGADLTLYDYIATFITADGTVDQKEIPALWTRFSEGDSVTNTLTESYRATGATPTMAQILFEILAGVLDHSITGTTKSIRNIAGATVKTYTLDSATSPTSITEAT